MSISMFTGVSGMLAHQRRLDVIADNIANVNTVGFRGSRALFQDLFSQTLEGARPPTANNGGSNAKQVGLGVTLATIDTNFSQGSLQTTGFASDLAIQGRGFFVLSSDPTKQALYFTRDGSFQLNANGELIDPATGLYVQGYPADPVTGIVDTNAGLQNLVVPIGGVSTAEATSTAVMTGNLSSDTPAADTVVRSLRVFDALGTVRNITVTFTKTANPNEWTWVATTVAPASIAAGTGTGTLQFDGNGVLTAGMTGNITLDFAAGPSVPDQPQAITVDFTNVTQLSALDNNDDPFSDLIVSNQNGQSRGVLEAYNVSQDGYINGVYSNGLTRVIGQVALASFSNEGGLVRWGENLFVSSSNSGNAQIGIPSTGGRGEVAGGVLEASNVDLGTEFANLILTQRGFQANARTVTTADTLLQETVNLVR